MYICNFACTYKLHEENLQEDMYRLQILQAFDLKEWDDDVIEKNTKILYEKIKNKGQLNEIITKIKESDKFGRFITFIGVDEYDLFKLLFIFDLFDLAHRCFCDIYNAGEMKEENKKMLLKNI